MAERGSAAICDRQNFSDSGKSGAAAEVSQLALGFACTVAAVYDRRTTPPYVN